MADGGSGAQDSALRQVVYLSARPRLLAETLAHVAHFLPWLTQAVVVAPDREAIRRAVESLELDVVVIEDGELLAAGERLPDAHSARNARLRLLLAERGPLDDVFVQSDDDYRPLKAVPATEFVEDGRLHSYAFYDLALWRRRGSTFDDAQHATYLAMSYLGGEHLAYGSHQPQAIDRRLYLEAFRDAAALSPQATYCEWSLPLNHGRLVAPERFHAPRVFQTMGWPRYPHEWPYWRRPEQLAFENLYPELYAPGHLFAGISMTLDRDRPEQQAFEKIQRWYAFDVAAGSLDFPPGVANPWQTTRGRRAFFGLARRARKLFEYTALEERTQLSELAGAIDRLERRP